MLNPWEAQRAAVLATASCESRARLHKRTPARTDNHSTSNQAAEMRLRRGSQTRLASSLTQEKRVKSGNVKSKRSTRSNERCMVSSLLKFLQQPSGPGSVERYAADLPQYALSGKRHNLLARPSVK